MDKSIEDRFVGIARRQINKGEGVFQVDIARPGQVVELNVDMVQVGIDPKNKKKKKGYGLG